jgi:tetratricopeptide (TPR) repeat protein
MGIRIISLIILLTGILLSKSIVAIVLAFWYLWFLCIQNPPTPLRFMLPFIKGDRTIVRISGIISVVWIFLLWTILIAYFPEKLHSFLSRFYLWETTLRIIFSDIKIFLIWWGAETLSYYFDSFKVPEVYIFENYWFTADRPHNFILNIFYSFWVFALWLFLYWVYYFFKNFRNTPQNIALLLFLLFGIIHYFSIASYALLILILVQQKHFSALFWQEKWGYNIPSPHRRGLGRGVLLVVMLISLTWAYYSIKLYTSEILYNQKKYVEASENFTHPKYLIKISNYSSAKSIENITSQKSFKSQITLLPEKQNLCNQLTENYPSAENYIYCGNIFWNLEKIKLAREYYNKWLAKLPDLWNQESKYWDNYFVKHTITGNRFFSEKFWDINWVLEKVWK